MLFIEIFICSIFTIGSVRGNLGTLLVFACNIGILLAFILGYFLTYDVVAWILSIFVFVFVILFALMPESPQFLIQRNQLRKAEKSWRYLRNIPSADKQDTTDPISFEFQQLLKSQPNTSPSSNKVKSRSYKLSKYLIIIQKQFICFILLK